MNKENNQDSIPPPGGEALFPEQVRAIRESGLYRDFSPLESPQAGYVIFRGRKVLNLCSNNYLCLSDHPDVKKACMAAVEKWGTGSGGSRLLGGTQAPHVELETKLAGLHFAERALAFNSGYTANTSILPALSSLFTHVFSDRLNHASIVDGIVQSRLPFTRYRHLDMGHLEDLLEKHPSPEKAIVASETLFSMDGDFLPLSDMLALQQRFGFFLYLDEAHSFGGYPEYLAPVMNKGYTRTVVVGTLGKAAGCFGAFTAGSGAFIEYIVNRCRGFIFSTALPPAVAASASAALDVMDSEVWRREALHRVSAQLKSGFDSKGWDSGRSTSHILPLIVGENPAAKGLSDFLFDNGIFSLAIRPPTVPRGTARLRLSLHCEIQEQDVEHLMDSIAEGMKGLAS